MAIGRIVIVAIAACLSACQNTGTVISVGYQDGGNLEKGDKVLLEGIAVGEVLALHFVPKEGIC